MKRLFQAGILFLLAISFAAGQSGVLHPYETETALGAPNPIDTLVRNRLRQRGIQPANQCSDEVFIRRAYLDVLGTLPRLEEVRAFLADRNSEKRKALVEALFQREEFADYWSLKWCDVLRVKSEFPINLWPNAVQAYHQWIRAAVRDNMRYDQFARELLTSSGSNFRVPPVNFYRAIQGRGPSAAAAAVALTFMGTRIETWPAERRTGMEAFFSRVAYKPTAEWKEEIVCLDPAKTGAVSATFPDGRRVQIPDGQDPRKVFAGWLITPKNSWFARNAANRTWCWLTGRGIIHEADDIRSDNPPANPELLAYLEKELVKSGYDLRHLFRLILNSQTYQQSSIPRSSHGDAAALSAHYLVRRLDAEVLIDALSSVFGPGEGYSSAIPEPFTYIPENQRTIGLADGSITSQFLEMFGRPARDTGLEGERNNQPSDEQRLHLLNSTAIQQKIQRSRRLTELINATRTDRRRLIGALYLAILSRYPTEQELAAAVDYATKSGQAVRETAVDLAWALINTKEFLFRH
ncbi:MAG: DUF1553 domain-containing protein [Acidobacteria bacterium]|nr:MAG: DUF1553 domain-containing protein [Acidobacteriota bacterium]